MPHHSAKSDEERTLVAYGIPLPLLRSAEQTFRAVQDEETPTKIIRLNSNIACKLIYKNKADRNKALERGTIQIYGQKYNLAEPKNRMSNVCKMCKSIECEERDKCSNISCGVCSKNHQTSFCTEVRTQHTHCVTCGNEGHYYTKCPLVKYE